MALRDQPYLPLYIQDFLTDEKLNECSASATGVYIKIMCIMHKSETYGKILLRQKDKQTTEQIKNFASKFARLLPFSEQIIYDGLNELLSEKVLFIEDDFICQKRMIKDNSLSVLRAKSGKIGGKKTKENFAMAKTVANAENENENEIENEIKNTIKDKSENFKKLWFVLISEPKWKKKSDNALWLALQKLNKEDEETAIQMMKNTIEGGWQGIFEIQKNKNGKSKAEQRIDIIANY